MNIFCIEILGESPYQKVLVQSGWSGKDYPFYYNSGTSSHLRAYYRMEDYLDERVDMHKSSNVWPLLANMVPVERIEPHAFVGIPPTTVEAEKPKGRRVVIRRGGEE